MASIKLIGFDMDHTLAPYRKETFEDLAYRQTVIKMVEAGYPAEFDKLVYKPEFLIRGLLVDLNHGNVLKVDGHKYVKTAYHGYHKLNKSERHQLYNKQSFRAEDFPSLDSFFALSEVQLFVDIVEFMRTNPGRINKTFEEVYRDVRTNIDLCHQDGSIKKHVLQDPERYFLRDKYLGTTLLRLIDSGKFLFLLTNSKIDYTRQIMSFLLDGQIDELPQWRDYWDFVIVAARKPDFFFGSQDFIEIDDAGNALNRHEGPFRPDGLYSGGDARTLEELTGYSGDEILYVGDHIFGDIIQSKGRLNWRTLLIVGELEEEMAAIRKTAGLMDQIQQEIEYKEAADEQVQRSRSLLSAAMRHLAIAKTKQEAKRIEALELEIGEKKKKLQIEEGSLKEIENRIRALVEERERQFHPVWGGLMKVGLERSRFARQAFFYACLYTASVSNLRFYGPSKRFVAASETLPHEGLEVLSKTY